MVDPSERRVWLRRLRWRLRGAWQWPALWVLTVVDALLLRWLPFSGDEGSDIPAGLILAGFANLGIVAAGGPLVALLVRRRRPDLPRVVAADRAATALMLALLALLVAGGIAHRPVVRDAGRDADTQLAAARAWFRDHAPLRFRPGIGSERVFKAGPDLFRTCIPGPDPERNLCVFVDTARTPPRVREDPDQRPNAVVAGPDNPGLH